MKRRVHACCCCERQPRKRLISGAAGRVVLFRRREFRCFCVSERLFCVFAAEVPVRTHGRGQRERSLIREDRSNTLAFPG